LITATAAFINIPKIKKFTPENAYSAMVGLHRALETYLKDRDYQPDVLSAMTGGILLVPDHSNIYIHNDLAGLADLWFGMGIPVRMGVVHGEIEVIIDVDGNKNAVGELLNVAARLATQKDKPGCLLHQSYLDFTQGIIGNDSLVRQGKFVAISGKSHDVAKMRALQLNAASFPTATDSKRIQVGDVQINGPVNAVAIAYDLPQFSAGDRSELSKRVRSVADAFSTFRAEGFLNETLYFSPGGDGGIIVLQTKKREGYEAAERIAQLLQVESQGRHEQVQAVSRIGLHYGPVYLYNNAVQLVRPTGQVCFVADSLASDLAVSTIPREMVVFSEAFIDIAAEGSKEFFRLNYEEISQLQEGPAKGLRRFVKRANTSEATQEVPIGSLGKRQGSWEPQ